jgi:hypothetical protein
LFAALVYISLGLAGRFCRRAFSPVESFTTLAWRIAFTFMIRYMTYHNGAPRLRNFGLQVAGLMLHWRFYARQNSVRVDLFQNYWRRDVVDL